MIFKAIIESVKEGFKAVIKAPFSDMKSHFISPFGLYTKPKKANGVTFNKGQYVLALHDVDKVPISLKDNDIVLTDGKSYIYFNFDNGDIRVKTNKVIFDCKEYETNCVDYKVNATAVDFKSGTLKHNGVDIGMTHKHGGVLTGGSQTTIPVP